MTPIKQTTFGDKIGNCFAACVASLLDLSISDVPNFCAHPGDDWWEVTQQWLQKRGLCALDISAPIEIAGVYNLPCIVSGTSPRGDFLHCIVGQINSDGLRQYLHDPHPDNKFIVGAPKRLLFLVPLNPAKAVTA